MTVHPPSGTAAAIVAAVRAGQLRAEDVVAAALEHLADREPSLHAWAHVDPDLALAQARALDRLDPSDRGPLHGVPIGVKDILDTADQPTGHGSPVYAGHRPAVDATAVARLRAAGAVVVGKTVTTEFALFHPGPTVNPHDPTRTPGGSSSGSAAAVGAGTVPLAVGTQTAGSVVRPASFCGVLGVKPTFGAVSVDGVKACAPNLDTVGVFAITVADAATALGVMAGAPDRFEPFDLPARPRVGFVRPAEWDRVDPACRTILDAAVAGLADHVDVVEVALPATYAGLVEAQIVVMTVEATRSLAGERREHPELLSDRLHDVLTTGDRHAWAYDAALAHLDRCRAQLGDVFADVDVVLGPSVLGEAPPVTEGTGDPLLCRIWTALRTPAVSVPGLIGPSGLPLGVQVVAPPGRDDLALGGAARLAELLADGAGTVDR